MSKQDTLRYIYERKRNTRSVDEQANIAHALWENGIDQNHEGLKRSEIEDALALKLDYTAGTSLSHLEDIDVVEEFCPPGVETLVIARWMTEENEDGEIVLGRVGEAAEEGIDGIIDDLSSVDPQSGATTAADGSGTTIRSVLSSEFDLLPEKVESYLRSTDKPVKVLNRAIEAIKENEGVDVGDDYGEITFINRAHRFRLDTTGIDLYEQ